MSPRSIINVNVQDQEAHSVFLLCLRLASSPRSVFRHLIQVDPDAFWFTLNEVHCPWPYRPPHPDLPPVRLSGMGRQRDEFSDNVLKLLSEEEFRAVGQSVD